MFQFLYIIGPAAITYLMIHHVLSKNDAVPYLISLIELTCYAAMDAAITSIFLSPFGWVAFSFDSFGIKNIQYSGTAFLFSLVVGVVMGVVISVIKKYVEFSIEVKSQNGEKSYEIEKR